MTDNAVACRHVTIDPDTGSLSIAQGLVQQPAAGEVLINVQCAGINRADLLQRKGLYPPPEDASPILGLEVAGTVKAVGPDVGDWQVGDAICALTHGGGYADYALAPVGQCMPVPNGFSMQEAAALPEALLTIWHNLYQRAGLKSGDNVLVHGGASGMGTMGVMMAHALGATVYTTAGTAEKCSALQVLGATRAINYREEDFEKVLGELGVAGSINVILDMIGGDYVQKNLNVAAPEGRIVNIAYMRGFKAEVNFAPLLMKRLTLTGSTLRAQTFAQKAVMVEELLEHVFPHLENGNIRPLVDSTFTLENAQDAHTRMESGEHMGKIILTL
ncbi:MAG: NADPH2:quinone reductase [Bacteroidia bacterium]|jgi:NADPH2:quinone reductase